MTTRIREANRTAEREMAAVIERAFCCQAHFRGDLASYDVDLVRDKPVAHAEFKARTCSVDKYPTVLLSHHKRVLLTVAHTASGLPPLLFVRWEDDFRFIDVREISAPLRMGGRYDRAGASNDWEPVYEVPIRDMGRVPQ